MPRRPRRPHPLAGQIFHAREAVGLGLLTREDLRTTAWRRLFHNVYADSRLHMTHRRRCVAYGTWSIPPSTTIAGRSAALFHGAPSPGDTEPVEVLVHQDARFGPQENVRVHVSDWDQYSDVVYVDRILVTGPERTVWDVASWYDVVEAVVIVDAMLARHTVTIEQLRAYGATRVGRRGSRRFCRVVDLVDAGAESPQESRLRVRIVLAGLPRPITQYVINRDGRFIARADLAWPDARVAVEYDGAWHDQARQFDRDRDRLNQMQLGDWIVLVVTAKRLREDFDGFVAELRALLRSRFRELGASDDVGSP